METSMQPKTQRVLHLTAVISLLSLIVLCTAWELVLAPLRPGGSWMAIKALPLLLPLAGVLRRDIYTLQWASMLVHLYFIEGVVRAWSDTGMSALLASLEIAFSSLFFFCAIFFLSPYKKMAKKITREAIAKAAIHED
jgi:uncharacterized membrane protein